jgi:hypothetical protein
MADSFAPAAPEKPSVEPSNYIEPDVGTSMDWYFSWSNSARMTPMPVTILLFSPTREHSRSDATLRSGPLIESNCRDAASSKQVFNFQCPELSVGSILPDFPTFN